MIWLIEYECINNRYSEYEIKVYEWVISTKYISTSKWGKGLIEEFK